MYLCQQHFMTPLNAIRHLAAIRALASISSTKSLVGALAPDKFLKTFY